jgi:hypothetical protein
MTYSLFDSTCGYGDHVILSYLCPQNVSNLFLCVGLRNKSYCILNKQYTKEEYEELVPRIIEKMMTTPLRQGFEGQMEWGEFFPTSLSPFGYNETVAQEYFPMMREEALGSSPEKGRLGGVRQTETNNEILQSITHPNPPFSGRE